MYSRLSILTLAVQPGYGLQNWEIASKKDRAVMTGEEKKRTDHTSLLELIERSREGDIQAMEDLYEHFKGSLFSFIYRFASNYQVAEDLLQETFLKVFTHIQDVEKVETFKSWLYRIAVNTCYIYLRGNRARLQKTVPLRDVDRIAAEEQSNSERIELGSSLERAIQSLTSKLKSVFILHDVQGFTHDEIARILGWSAGTSKSQLFKARMRIRKYLKNNSL